MLALLLVLATAPFPCDDEVHSPSSTAATAEWRFPAAGVGAGVGSAIGSAGGVYIAVFAMLVAGAPLFGSTPFLYVAGGAVLYFGVIVATSTAGSVIGGAFSDAYSGNALGGLAGEPCQQRRARPPSSSSLSFPRRSSTPRLPLGSWDTSRLPQRVSSQEA